MRNPRNWKQKPPIGTPLDRTNPLTQGLVFFCPFWENGSNSVVDVVNNIALPFTNSPVWQPGGSPQTGGGLFLNTTTQRAGSVLPPILQLQPPMTLVLCFRPVGVISNTSNLFGLYLNSSGAAAFGNFIRWTAGTGGNTGNVGYLVANSSGASSVTQTVGPVVVGSDYLMILSLGVTSSSCYFMPLLGKPSITNNNYGFSANSVYTGTSQVTFGASPGYTAISRARIHFGGIYSRALTMSQASSLASNPWQIFRRKPDVRFIQGSNVVSFFTNVFFDNNGDFLNLSDIKITGSSSSLTADGNLSLLNTGRRSKAASSFSGDGNISFSPVKMSSSSYHVSADGNATFGDRAKFGGVSTYVNAGDFSSSGKINIIQTNIVFHTFIGNPRGFIQ